MGGKGLRWPAYPKSIGRNARPLSVIDPTDGRQKKICVLLDEDCPAEATGQSLDIDVVPVTNSYSLE